MASVVYPYCELGEGLPVDRIPYLGRASSLSQTRALILRAGHHFPAVARRANSAWRLLHTSGGWQQLAVELTERFMALPPMQVRKFTHAGQPAHVHVPAKVIAGQLKAPMSDIFRFTIVAGQYLEHCAACGRIHEMRTAVRTSVPAAFFRRRPADDIRPGEPPDAIREELLPLYEFYGETAR